MSDSVKDALGGAFAFLLVVAVCIGIIAAGFAGCGAAKGWSRHQRQLDAKNNVKITTINIQKAQQEARIVRAQNARIQALADQRVIQAKGIRAAQDHIAKTLTPLYIQWEAIQAQLQMANSPNHTVIWAPSGANGVPLVSTVDLQRTAEGK